MTTTTVPTAVPVDGTGPKPEFSVVLVSPEMAQRWLGKNHANRNKRDVRVAAYVRDMLAGNWLFTGESIKFDWNGRLIDGQHRLSAIATAGVTLPVLVIRNLDPRVQDVLDSGSARTAADMLSMHEVSSGPRLAATARLVIAWNQGAIKSSDTQFFPAVTHSEIRDAIQSDPYIQWAVQVAGDLKSTSVNPGAMAFALYLTGRVDSAAAREFFTDLHEMRTSGIGDPRFTVLKRLAAAKDNRERLTSVQQSFLLIKAWNAWRAGRTVKTLKLSVAGEKFPEPV